jgi:hypothetical protein
VIVVIRTKKIVGENCDLLGHYAGSSGNFIPTSRDVISVPPSGVKNPLTPEGGTENSSRNVGNKLPLLAA